MSKDVAPSPFTPEEVAEVRRYAVVIEWSDENDAYLVTVPDLPGLITDGPTRAAAAEMGEDAIAVWISGLRTARQPVPAPHYSNLPSHLRPQGAPSLAGIARSR